MAKLTERENDGPLALTETLNARTAEGAILGTVAYMSPEQAEGRKIDCRSDIFSFGAVLYEMVAGRRAFEGESPLSTLAAILHKEPQPLNQLVEGSPRDLEKIIARCLRKDPARRFQLIDDVRIALEDAAEEPAEIAPQPAPRRGALTAGIAAAAAAAGFLLAYLLTPARGPDPSSYRFIPVATGIEVETQPAWSRDGKALAYVASIDGVTQVFVRNLNSPTPAQITSSPSACTNPFWSPDGTHIYYHAGGDLWSVGAAGGAANRVMERVNAGCVSPNGKVLAFMRGMTGNVGLWITTDKDTQPQKYRATPFPEMFTGGAAAPQFAPDGSKILVLMSRDAGGLTGEFWVLPYPSGTPRRALASLNTSAAIQRVVWMPDSRHIVFGANMPGGSGTHLYMGDTENSTIRRVTSSTSEENFPSVSPDGTQIAFASGGLEFDLVEAPLNGDPVRPLLATARNEEFPAWAPSGGQYVYSTNAGGTVELWLRSVQEGWAPAVGHSEFTGVVGLESAGEARLLTGRPEDCVRCLRVAAHDLDLAHRRRQGRATRFRDRGPARAFVVPGWELDRLPASASRQVGIGEGSLRRGSAGRSGSRCSNRRQRTPMVSQRPLDLLPQRRGQPARGFTAWRRNSAAHNVPPGGLWVFQRRVDLVRGAESRWPEVGGRADRGHQRERAKATRSGYPGNGHRQRIQPTPGWHAVRDVSRRPEVRHLAAPGPRD